MYTLFVVVAGLLGVVGCTEDVTAPEEGEVNVEVVSGMGQTGTFGSPLPEDIVVEVTRGGTPVEGIFVTWLVRQPYVGEFTVSTVCGVPVRPRPPHRTRFHTFTDQSGRTRIQWMTPEVPDTMPARDCRMETLVSKEEQDSVLAADTLIITWQP
jgi:hypothetical protein